MGNHSFKNVKSKGIMNIKQMKELHKQILFEYPFLCNIYESMLVTDNNLPDNPIVWANDQFEQMTLYSKEEILGRNCRFLQGKHTDPNLVKKIRHAVDNSLQLEVELLNYRKDGVAFWNCFVMLPVHAPGNKSGRATHFIAIQKDVTVLKEPNLNPAKWSSPEVAMWLESIGFGQYGKAVVQNSFTGETLLNLEQDDFPAVWALWGVALSSEQKKLMNNIQQLQNARQMKRMESSSSRSSTSSPRGYQTPTVAHPSEIVPKDFWLNAPREDRVVMKFYIDGREPELLLLDRNVNYTMFMQQVERSFGNYKAFFEEGEYEMEVQGDSDLESILLLNHGQTICFRLEQAKARLPSSATEYLKNLPLPVIITDSLGIIMYLNRAMLESLGYKKQRQMMHQHISAVVPSLKDQSPKAMISGIKMTINNTEYLSRASEHVSTDIAIAATGKGNYTFSFLPSRQEQTHRV